LNYKWPVRRKADRDFLKVRKAVSSQAGPELDFLLGEFSKMCRNQTNFKLTNNTISHFFLVKHKLQNQKELKLAAAGFLPLV
jgi:hypothetical protein